MWSLFGTQVIVFYLGMRFTPLFFIFRPTSLPLGVIRIFATNCNFSSHYFDPRDSCRRLSSCSSLFDGHIFSTCLSLLLTFFPFTFCLVRYTVSRFFKSYRLASTNARLCCFFLSAVSIVFPVSISSAHIALAPSLSCLYTHFFVSPLTRFTLDLPPSRSHIASLQLS